MLQPQFASREDMVRICRGVLVRAVVCCIAGTLFVSPAVFAAEKRAPGIHAATEELPEPVREMRAAILDAARTGEVEMLRPVLESNELMPTVSFGGDEDPIAYWKQISGDGRGREIMAAMAEILEMPFARINVGAADEMYVWPYLAEMPLERLTPAQQVDLYRLVSPDEAKTMAEFGGYIHYRLGIGPDGTWHYFVAGD